MLFFLFSTVNGPTHLRTHKALKHFRNPDTPGSQLLKNSSLASQPEIVNKHLKIIASTLGWKHHVDCMDNKNLF
jgi:hypothetical protein